MKHDLLFASLSVTHVITHTLQHTFPCPGLHRTDAQHIDCASCNLTLPECWPHLQNKHNINNAGLLLKGNL